MHRNVESSLEETLPILKQAKDLNLIQPHEIRVIIKKRRDLEYGVLRTDDYTDDRNKRNKYLKYIVFEKELVKVIHKRLLKAKKSLEKKQKLKKAHILVGRCESRVNLMYSRALRRLPGDAELWLHYIHHCIRENKSQLVQRVLIKAVAVCGHDYRIWLKAMSYHFDQCNDTRTARAVAQRALRMLPDCAMLWVEYFKLELFYLIRLTMRRIAMGVAPPVGDEGHEDAPEGEGIKRDENDDTRGNAKSQDSQLEEGTSDVDDEGEGDRVINAMDSDGDGDEQQTREACEPPQKLSFWAGGVPLAVFKAACKKLALTQTTCMQFYLSASECPIVPSPLLTAMVNILSELSSYANMSVTRLLKLRVVWDCAYVELERRYAILKSDAKTDEQKSLINRRKTREIPALVEQGEGVLSELIEMAKSNDDLLCAAVDSRFSNSISNSSKLKAKDKDKRESIIAFLKNFTKLLIATDASFKDDVQLTQLRVLLLRDNDAGNEFIAECQKGTATWNSVTLLKYLQSGYDEFTVSSEDISECVRRLCLVPFRNKQEDDQALCAYLNRGDIPQEEMEQIFNFLLSNPPTTLPSLTALANALISRLEQPSPPSYTSQMHDDDDDEEEDEDEDADEDEVENTDDIKKKKAKLIQQIRRVFMKCTGLSEVKRDVSFWIRYLDFERRVTNDAKAVTIAHGKAMRTLDVDHRQLFVERLSLSSLK